MPVNKHKQTGLVTGKFSTLIITLISFCIILSVTISSVISYQLSKNQLETSLGIKLQALVESISPLLNMEKHENTFVFDTKLEGVAEYRFLQKQLLALSISNGLDVKAKGSPIYTLRNVETEQAQGFLEFVVFSHQKSDRFLGNRIPMEAHHIKALTGKTAVSGLYTDTDGTWISAVAPLFDEDHNVIGLLQADHHVDYFNQQATHIIYRLFAGGVLAGIIALFCSYKLSRNFVDPLHSIVRVIRLYGKGEFSVRSQVNCSGEIKELSDCFNRMADTVDKNQTLTYRLKEYRKKVSENLVESNITLEKKVRARTKKLLTINEELETTVDRLKQSQAQLLQAEKMASIGQLAAGVAHEINNPMAFISCNISVIGDYLSVMKNSSHIIEKLITAIECDHKNQISSLIQSYHEHKNRENIQDIFEDCDCIIAETLTGAVRINEIVLNLKTFSHVSQELEDIDINECISTTLKIANNELKYHCELETNFSDLPLLKCRRGELNQVLLNLVVNASHAIEGKGKIQVNTSLVGDDICIEIADTGVGIEKDNISKLFDPFYTTKPVGQGTGLGLSISYNIINSMGGSIAVDSEVGKGSCFKLQLPLNFETENDICIAV